MSKETATQYRSTPQYKEGIEHYVKHGNKKMSCPDSPYPSGGEKISWLVGWLDARSADVLGEQISA